MQQSNRELWMAFFAIIFITLVYLFMMSQYESIPPASGLFGHGIGIIGFVLMLMTEILYSLRKRSRSARWGRMANWLQFHIFTGLVGPYMVLLHTSWKFNGLAGIVTLLTLIVVLSGIVGRYLYTAIPRTADGVELERVEVERLIESIENELQRWAIERPQLVHLLDKSFMTGSAVNQSPFLLIIGRIFMEWRYRFRAWGIKRRLDANLQAQVEKLERMVKRKRILQRQVITLAMARRLLALWHTVHIPIGMALFTSAFVHVIAAIYYATLLR